MFRAGRKTEAREAVATFASYGAGEQRSRALPFTFSLCLHLAVVTVAVGLDWFWQSSKPYQVRLPEQVIAESESQVVWYPLQGELPAVQPLDPSRQASPTARARFRSPQTIVASDPDPQSDRQMIWGPAPDITIEQDIPAPNLLSWSAPRPAMPRFEISEPSQPQPGRQALAVEAAPATELRQESANSPQIQQPRLRMRYLSEARDLAVPERRALNADRTPELAVKASEGLGLAELNKGKPLRFWTEDRTAKTPRQEALDSEATPDVAASATQGLDPAAFHKLARLRYWMSEGEGGRPAESTLDAAPAPDVSSTPPAGSAMAVLEPRTLLRFQAAGDPSGQGARTAPRRRALEPGPGLSRGGIETGSAGPGTGASWAAAGAERTLARVVVPGESTTAGAGSNGGPSAGRPGGLADRGDQPNLAVVGVEADPNSSGKMPPGQRRGRFAASPDGGPGGGDQIPGPTTSAAVRVPNLSVGGLPAPSEASAARTAAARRPRADRSQPQPEGLEIFRRFRNPREFTKVPLDPSDLGVTMDPQEPGALFLDKAVYTLAVNMPNITSYSGSWVIRFAEMGSNSETAGQPPSGHREESAARTADAISAPSPRFKVDPKYIRSAADEGVEGKVVLYAVIGEDGHVHRVRVMQSLDERLDESAVEAFSKWRFDPATSSGLPVGVEAVVEIPFQLAPPERARRRLRY